MGSEVSAGKNFFVHSQEQPVNSNIFHRQYNSSVWHDFFAKPRERLAYFVAMKKRHKKPVRTSKTKF